MLRAQGLGQNLSQNAIPYSLGERLTHECRIGGFIHGSETMSNEAARELCGRSGSWVRHI